MSTRLAEPFDEHLRSAEAAECSQVVSATVAAGAETVSVRHLD
jgi:hypothetical protein